MMLRRRRGIGGRRVKARVFWAGVAIVLAIGAAELCRPFSVLREQSVRTAQLRATRASLLAERAALEEERVFLATEAGQEAAARRMGYLRPGERRVVFVPAKPVEQQPEAR